MLNKDEIDLSEIIEEYGLDKHITELDEVGLTVVPQATLKLDDSLFELFRDAILRVG